MQGATVKNSEAVTRDASGSESSSTVEKAVVFMTVIAESDGTGMGVTQIAKDAGVPKATAYRILKTLVDLNTLYFDAPTKKYHLGPALLNIGLAAMRQLDVPKLARPYLIALAEQTQETATLSMRQGAMRVYLDQVPSTQEIKMTVPIGMVFPLYAGASSKAILSTFSEEELDAYLASITLNPLTEATILDQETLRAEIEEIRILGYAVSRGERQRDAGSVAAPIRGSGGEVFGALSTSGPLQRFDRTGTRNLGRLVKENADRLSAEIGYRP